MNFYSPLLKNGRAERCGIFYELTYKLNTRKPRWVCALYVVFGGKRREGGKSYVREVEKNSPQNLLSLSLST